MLLVSINVHFFLWLLENFRETLLLIFTGILYMIHQTENAGNDHQERIFKYYIASTTGESFMCDRSLIIYPNEECIGHFVSISNHPFNYISLLVRHQLDSIEVLIITDAPNEMCRDVFSKNVIIDKGTVQKPNSTATSNLHRVFSTNTSGHSTVYYVCSGNSNFTRWTVNGSDFVTFHDTNSTGSNITKPNQSIMGYITAILLTNGNTSNLMSVLVISGIFPYNATDVDCVISDETQDGPDVTSNPLNYSSSTNSAASDIALTRNYSATTRAVSNSTFSARLMTIIAHFLVLTANIVN